MADADITPQQQGDASDGTTKASRLIGEAEALLASLKVKLDEAEAARNSALEAAAAAQAKLSEITAASTTATAARTKIADEQAVIAAKSEHIQGAQEHADKVRAELDRVQTAATQQATEAEGLRTRAQAAADSAAELLAAIRAQKTSVEADATEVVAARDLAKASAATAKGLADKSDTTEERLAAYEKRLAELDQQAAEQLKTITELLPGATSTGLAHAFDDRRKTFLSPATKWQWWFVGSVLALIGLALTGLYQAKGSSGWDELARLWLARLPIAGALVWLALHAGREAALAKRLEEDYGYKAAIAASFQGFQKRMAEVGKDAQAGSPLAKLCEDTLATLASPPGRIYDKHRLTVTPSDEMAAAAKKAITKDAPAG